MWSCKRTFLYIFIWRFYDYHPLGKQSYSLCCKVDESLSLVLRFVADARLLSSHLVLSPTLPPPQNMGIWGFVSLDSGTKVGKPASPYTHTKIWHTKGWTHTVVSPTSGAPCFSFQLISMDFKLNRNVEVDENQLDADPEVYKHAETLLRNLLSRIDDMSKSVKDLIQRINLNTSHSALNV